MNKKYTVDGHLAHPLFIFAHGAGAGSDSEFMQQMAQLIAAQGVCVVRFDFPYMEQRAIDGKRRPPQRMPALLDDYRALIGQLGRPCVIGGKSMGGRVASLLMQAAGEQDEVVSLIRGCACLGYPFHPPGKPESLRTGHLQQLQQPLLIVQGTRDALGNKDEVDGYALDAALQWLWLEDGDHDLKPRKKSGFSHEQHMQQAAAAVAAFVHANVETIGAEMVGVELVGQTI